MFKLFITSNDIRSISYIKNEETNPNDSDNLSADSEEIILPEELLHMKPEEFEKELEIAFQKGFHEGELQGFKKCEKELKPNLALFNDIINALENQRSDFLQKSETFMVELAGKIAKKIVTTELKFNPQIIKKIVVNLLKKVLDNEEMSIILNDEDAPIIEEYKSELLAINPQLKKINIERDDSIKRGGCIIETKSGILDSRLDEMFVEIEKALLKHLER